MSQSRALIWSNFRLGFIDLLLSIMMVTSCIAGVPREEEGYLRLSVEHLLPGIVSPF